MSSRRTIRARAGTNLEGASTHNRRVIVDAMRINGALSRADLARATRLTKQTISNIVDDLQQGGVVRPQKTVRIARGQPITPYELVPDGAFALGLQIDRHVTRLIAVDLIGTVRIRLEAPLTISDPHQGLRVLLDLIAEARHLLKAESASGTERLVGLGAAMPGPFGMVDMQDSPWMMSGWQSFPLVRELSEQTGLQVAPRQLDRGCHRRFAVGCSHAGIRFSIRRPSSCRAVRRGDCSNGWPRTWSPCCPRLPPGRTGPFRGCRLGPPIGGRWPLVRPPNRYPELLIPAFPPFSRTRRGKD